MSTTTTRRRRSIETTAPAVDPVTQDMKNLAVETFLSNKQMNAAKNKSEKAREALLVSMKAAGVKSFTHTANDEAGRPITIAVNVDAPTKTYVDVNTLKDLVTPEVFMLIVSATEKSVEEHAGKLIAMQAKKTRTSEENVFVKAAK